MYPHERSLVESLKDEPFVLIGVNSDPDREFARKAVADEGLTWRSFWNGPEGPDGPIALTWNVASWPTLFLLDAEGRVRRRWLGPPRSNEEVDQAIHELLAERKGG